MSFSRTGDGLCIYHLFVLSNWNILRISQWITLPTHPVSPYTLSVLICCIRLLCDWSFRLCHRIALIYFCVLSILALIWLFLMALSCAAIRRDSVFRLRFPFLSQVHVFWSEMLFISRLKRRQSCFSSHFCFLVVVILSSIVLSVSFLIVVISPRSCFSM